MSKEFERFIRYTVVLMVYGALTYAGQFYLKEYGALEQKTIPALLFTGLLVLMFHYTKGKIIPVKLVWNRTILTARQLFKRN